MCGIIGTFGPSPDAALLVYDGLYQLQHRGQEQAGVAVADGEKIRTVTTDGYVTEVFKQKRISQLPGHIGIGHVRYSTAGGSRTENAQPITVDSRHGQISIVHNGNLTNEFNLRESLRQGGTIFRTTSDTELILHLFAQSRQEDPVEAVIDAVRQIRGAYSLLIALPDKLIAVRDPNGFRPLVVGHKDGQWFAASETVALDIELAEYTREVLPGEMIVWSAERTHPITIRPFVPAVPMKCAFEPVYFARPDSMVFGQHVNDARERMGQLLARQHPAAADIVVPVLDSGMNAAIGFAQESGLPLKLGLIRNHYVGRSFIEPEQSKRETSVRHKLNPSRNILRGQRVVLVDDSIVRGTTSRKIVSMVRSAGATEVHVRISCPPTVGSCHYGVDTPRSEDLIANQLTLDGIRNFLKADSLGYLSLWGLKAALNDENDFCYSCYTGHYPLLDDAIRLGIERRRSKSKTAPG